MRAVGAVYELVAAFIEELDFVRLSASLSYRRLVPAREYIDASYSEEMTLSSLARLCNMSETNFRRRFLEVFGETPFAYRDRLRILYAKDYLLGGYYTVTETAEKCGFTDVSYFCRFFKKHTGLTPKEFSLL